MTRFFRISIFILISLAWAASVDAETLKLGRVIPLPGVKGRFDHFAIDVKGNRLFAAALGNNTLEVIALAAGKGLQSLSGMAKPTGVLYLPECNQIWAANGDSGKVQILDGASYKIIDSVSPLPDADNLRFDPKTKRVYAGYGNGALGIIDSATRKLEASVKLPAHPESFQLEKNGPRIFVNVPGAKQIAVIDREKRTVIEAWPVEKFEANFPMALDEANGRLFVGCRKPARLLALDIQTGKPLVDLAISGDIDDLFFDAALKRLYLSCGEGFLDVLAVPNPNTIRLEERIPTAPGARTCFFSPERRELYLAVPQRGKQSAEFRVFHTAN